MSRPSTSKLRDKNGARSPDIQTLSLAAPVRHALQALAALAARPETCLDTTAVARRFGLPAAALSKSFQLLARRGLLESRRGPGGGYRLAVPPEALTLASVAEALGAGGERRGRCLLGEKACRSDARCLLHDAAVAADAGMRKVLERLTLADLVADSRAAEARP